MIASYYTRKDGVKVHLGSFRPMDEDSVYESMKLLSDRLSDEPILLHWLTDALWEALLVHTGKGLSKETCPVCRRIRKQ